MWSGVGLILVKGNACEEWVWNNTSHERVLFAINSFCQHITQSRAQKQLVWGMFRVDKNPSSAPLGVIHDKPTILFEGNSLTNGGSLRIASETFQAF